MATNPFADTDLEQSWQAGFVAGYLAPEDDLVTPESLTTDQQDVYLQGVLAGREMIESVRVPLTTDSDQNETWKIILHVAIELAELGHAAAEISAGAAVLGTVGASAIFSFVSIGIFGPTQLPFFEEAAAQAVRQVQKQLHDDGFISDDIELFMAACNRTDHQHDLANDDDLTKRGWWHGRVFLNFNTALAEGQAHEHADDTRILRFQSAAPDLIDAIELNPIS